MRRRGVLGLLGGALAAGPSMAKEAVSSIASMQVPGALETASLANSATNYGLQSVSETNPFDRGSWLKSRLNELLGASEEQKKERWENTWVPALDPDLVTNRSFSLSAKILIQKKRNYDRDFDRERRSLLRQIADHLSGKEY